MPPCLSITKVGNTSRCTFSGVDRLVSGSVYRVRVVAPVRCFDDPEAVLTISDGSARVTAALTADPFRRGLWTGTLVVPERLAATVMRLEVWTGGSCIVVGWIGVDSSCRSGDSYGDSSSRWSVTPETLIQNDGVVRLRDMSQATVVLASYSGVVSIVPDVTGSAPFEAYVRFVTDGTWTPAGMPVLADGSVITWVRKDAPGLASRVWLVHIMTVAGQWFATMEAGRVGVGTDPDGVVVPEAEVP